MKKTFLLIGQSVKVDLGNVQIDDNICKDSASAQRSFHPEIIFSGYPSSVPIPNQCAICYNAFDCPSTNSTSNWSAGIEERLHVLHFKDNCSCYQPSVPHSPGGTGLAFSRALSNF